MNPIPEPDELLESECNALGLYGLPEPLLPVHAGAEGFDADPPARAALAPALSAPWPPGSPR